MIKWVFVFFISLIAPVVQAPILAQAVMTNPEIPRAKDAGRAVALKEIWRITDASGEFYFKRPVELKAADDGSLFVADEFELLKFSPEGKFLGNLLKKGEGPGETTEGYVTFTLSRNILYVFSYPDKVFCLNFDGELITDAKLPFQRNGALIGIFGNRIYLNETKQPDLKTMIESKLYDYRNVISALDPKTMIESSIMEFPQRFWYGRTGSSSAVYMIWDPCYFAMDEKGGKLAVVNSCDYLIHLADLTTGMLVKSFKREYRQVEAEVKESLKEWRKKSGVREKKFENDVLGIYFHGDLVWALTSTKDERKGVLFDVFNEKGEYIDCFYLKFPGQLLNIIGDRLFTKVENADGEIAVAYYLIGK